MSSVIVHGKCPQCGHRTSGHKFDSLGQTRCPECPEEKCTRVPARTNNLEEFPNVLEFGELTTVGIKPINEMTERELIEEIMHAQFIALTQSGKIDTEKKKRMVAQIRVSSATARIYREAGIGPNIWGGIFGGDW